MTYEMFKEIVIQNIKKYLPQDWSDAKIERNQFQKVNYMKDSIVFRKHPGQGMSIDPDVDVHYWYERYLKGASLDEALTELAEAVLAGAQKTEPMKEAMDFDKVKENVFCQLINTEQNKELLKTVPHREFNDLSIIYVWLVRDNSEGRMYSSKVTDDMAEHIGLNEQELYQLAMENTKRILPAVIKPMSEVIEELMGDAMSDSLREDMEEDPTPLYVISNSMRYYGASAILFEEGLQDLAEKYGEDFYIIPSSIHECIALPKSRMELEEVAEMVYEINMTQVELQDRLSNEVYQYDQNTREVTIATNVPNKSIADYHMDQDRFHMVAEPVR